MGKRSPRVLVVEDDAVERSLLAQALGEDGWEVQATADGYGIEDVVKRFRPHVAIIDVRLPVGPDGYEIAKRLRAASDLPLLLLSAADDEDDILAGFAAGGDDYVTKPFSMPQLLARLHALLRHSSAAPSGVREVGDLVLDDTDRTVTRCGTLIELTETDYRLLWEMSRHPGQVFTRAELLRLVWGYEGANPNVVEVHISSLRRKLDEHGLRLIHTVHGHGYVFRP